MTTKKTTKKTGAKTTAVAKKGATSVATGEVPAELMQHLGGRVDEMDVDREDMLIPKILIQQGQSAMVLDGDAGVGDLADSVEKTVLAKRGEAIEIVLFEPFKTHVNMKIVDDVEQFHSITPYEPGVPMESNDDEGNVIRHYKTLNYHCMLVSDIQARVLKPRVISFRSTGYKVAKTIEYERKALLAIGKGLPLCSLVCSPDS